MVRWGFYPAVWSSGTTADATSDFGERALAKAAKRAVIPLRRNRTGPRDFDKHLYQARHLIENFFRKLKQFRATATRYDKTARNFLAAIYLAAATIWLN
jgi:transposase